MTTRREKPCRYEKIDGLRCFELAETRRRVGSQTIDVCEHHRRMIDAFNEAVARVEAQTRARRAKLN